MTRSPLVLLGVGLLAARNRPSNPPPLARPSTVDAPAAIAPPTRPAEITEEVPSPASDAGQADPTTQPAPSADAGQARTFEAPGIRVEVEAGGSVHIRTTDLWDGGVDQTFETCAFVRNAIGPLRRSMAADRIAVLIRACGEPRPGERPPSIPAARPPVRPLALPPAARPPALTPPLRPPARPVAPPR